MRILTVVGARPNFMKAAPIIAAIDNHNLAVKNDPVATGARKHDEAHHILVHTGQHYDDLMSRAFFDDLGLPRPDVWLDVGSASHAVQTAEIMTRFEAVLLQQKPDVLIVVGDVNSTIACALVAAKAPPAIKPLIVHVEAGLRSFDRSMPEEINRILTDRLSDLLFVTEQDGVDNLLNEGVSFDQIHFVGNTMVDCLLAFKDKAETSGILSKLGLRVSDATPSAVKAYVVLTLHRPSNVDDRRSFSIVLSGLEELAAEYPIVFPVHPRTRHRMKQFGLDGEIGSDGSGIVVTEPLGYLDFVCLMKHARLVVTDSGGIQEETTCLGIPCVTVRESTERPVTVKCGTNVIAGTTSEGIRDAVRRQIRSKAAGSVPTKWDGHAAERIVDVLVREHARRAGPQR